jgi:hypothetical protein
VLSVANPISAESQHLLRLLDDHQWQPYDEIHARLAATVAPGKALRRYEKIEANREAHHGPRRGPGLSDDEKIASGRKAIAVDTINSLKKRYVQIEEHDGRRMLRRRDQPVPIADPRAAPELPECPRCGLGVADPDRHAEYHARTDPPAPAGGPAAFYSEAQVRGLLEDVVFDALDRFEKGMREFLIYRFAEMERQIANSLPRRYR